MIGVGDFQSNEFIKENVNRVLDSGRLSYGEFTEKLEFRWCQLTGAKYAIAVTSGTAALHAALWSAKIKYGWPDGKEVLVPGVTFVATANAVIHCNLIPVFVDVEVETGLMDITDMRRKINRNTVAIIPVHLFGQPADVHAIKESVRELNIFVLEDSAEALGATQYGVPVGNLGDAACFSTYVAHHVPAGIGGMITTNDSELADIMRSVVNHGRDIRYWKLEHAKSGASEYQFRFDNIGFNYRSTELISAVALGLLQNWDDMLERRRLIATSYHYSFNDLARYSFLTTQTNMGNVHSWMMFPVRYERAYTAPEKKYKFMDWLHEHGVDTRECLPLINQTAYSSLLSEAAPKHLPQTVRKIIGGKHMDALPNSDYWNRVGFYLPCHNYMTDNDVDYVIQKVRHYIGVVDEY